MGQRPLKSPRSRSAHSEVDLLNQMEFFNSQQRKFEETAREMIAKGKFEVEIPGGAGLRLLREESPELDERLPVAGGILNTFEISGTKFYVCAF